MGRPGVPSWIDAAGDENDEGRFGSAPPTASYEWTSAGPVGGSSRVQAALSRALAYLLWGGIALALVLGLVGLASRPAAAPPPATESAPPPPIPPPGGCAELVVAAWLAGDAALLAGVPGLPRATPEPDRRRAVNTYPAGVTPGEGAWGYLIGAEVELRDDDDQWVTDGTRFFSVTMVPTDGGDGCHGWSPATLPAEVAAPSLAGAEPPYPIGLPTTGTELSQTLAAFFAGLLTGAESLDRYVAPGVVIAPLAPPPYQQVEVTELRARTEPPEQPADGTVLPLLVSVTTDPDDLPLVYPVTVGVRDGRWEVVALDPLVGTTVLDPAAGGPAGSTDGD